MLRSFKIGGIHPAENKLTANKAIEDFPMPSKVVIPLNQHIGAPAQACVKKGDKVLVGQLIGTAAAGLSCNIHSTVSGTVTSLEPTTDKGGRPIPAVTIAVEGDEWVDTIDRSEDIVREIKLTGSEIMQKIAEMGVVGMGGAMFPTLNKINVLDRIAIDTLVINGVECEPYLTSDHRTMVEKSEEVLIGTKILQLALCAKRAIIGIECNKPDAIERLSKLAPSYSIEIVPLKMKYPQGGEKQLIDATVGKQVPSNKLPSDIGIIVQNVSTIYAIYQAIQKNRPLIDRIVTVTGKKLARTGNFRVRFGTSINDILTYCGFDGSTQDETYKIINGGPMMGAAMSNLDAAVLKGTSGIVLLKGKEAYRHEEKECIKCGKCVEACPMGLEPYLLFRLCELNRYDELLPNQVIDCIECGCCTFTCPAALPLLDYIRTGRAYARRVPQKK